MDEDIVNIINLKHAEAMDAADCGEWVEAYRLERFAADLCEHTHQPTCGVLYRSAGCLALEAGLKLSALRMVKAGLAGDPPQEIKQELEELWEKVNR